MSGRIHRIGQDSVPLNGPCQGAGWRSQWHIALRHDITNALEDANEGGRSTWCTASDALKELYRDLQKTKAPLERLRLISQGWRVIRNLNPQERNI